MERNEEYNFDAFVKAIDKIGMLDNKNLATLHHSAVSISDWAALQKVKTDKDFASDISDSIEESRLGGE